MTPEDRLVEAAELLLQRIDHNGGIGAYNGGPPFVVEPLRKALADYKASKGKAREWLTNAAEKSQDGSLE